MWTFEGCDVLVNGWMAADRRALAKRIAFFIQFADDVLRGKPCNARHITPFVLTGEAAQLPRFALHLPDGWHVLYEVDPDCDAEDGVVRIKATSRLGILPLQ